MRTKRLKAIYKWLLVCVMTAGLGIMGGTYAVWTDSLTVEGKLSTGKFDLFIKDQEPTLHLVDENDGIIDIPDNSIRYVLTDGKKGVNIFMEGSLPAELLEGNYIRIQFSMEKDENSTVDEVRIKEADFQTPDFQVSMKATGVFLAADGKLYEWEDLPGEYKEPLVFDVFRKVWKDGDERKGSLYLGLEEESGNLVARFAETPPAVEVNLEDMEGETERDTDQGDWGILVEYQCEVPFYLDQREADSQNQKLRGK